MSNSNEQSLDQNQEKQLLEQYASVSGRKILSGQSDLSPKDHAMSEMISWCRRQGHIVVLHDGKILTNRPGSRLVQNCKIVMLNQGLEPGDVYPATQSLINILLENAEDPALLAEKKSLDEVSIQQKRLRMLVKEALEVGASDIQNGCQS